MQEQFNMEKTTGCRNATQSEKKQLDASSMTTTIYA